MRLSIRAVTFLTLASVAYAGPPDFGKQELRTAIGDRHLLLSIETELNLNQPETFVITPVGSASIRVSGGDLRGLMYGLIDAADQVRSGGSVVRKTGEPGFRVRSVRITPSEAELTAAGFYLSDRWMKIFEILARNRINRLTFSLPVEHVEYDRLRFLSRLGQDYGVDLNVGLRPPAESRVTSAQIRKLLDEVVLIRGVQLDASREPADYFRTTVFPAIQQTGRRVTVDLRGAETRPDVIRAAKAAGVVILVAGHNFASALEEPYYNPVAVTSTAEQGDTASKLAALSSATAAGFELDLSGSNLENYERIYAGWGRAGYDYRAPGLAPGKAPPAPTKAKTPAKSTKKK